jgi:tripartite-type tricarboxylate transporter receptor subunit TctC
MIDRRRLLSALLLPAVAPARAQVPPGWPSRTVRLVVPAPAGGPTDALSRALAERLSPMWGQAVVVENKPGASEIIGASAVANAPPDGTTLLVGMDASLVQNPFLFAKMSYDPVTDLVPVTQVADLSMALIVSGQLPVNSMRELVALLKKDGSRYNVAIKAKLDQYYQLKSIVDGLSLTEVTYAGAAPAVTAMLAGDVHVLFASPSVAAPHVPSGRLKILALYGRKRSYLYPNVPTFEEAGYPELNGRVLVGLAAPRGVPPAVVHKIAQDVSKVVTDPAFATKYLDPHALIPVGSTPEQFAQALQRERQSVAVQAKFAGVVPQ